MPKCEKFINGITNCEETISKYLNNKESMDAMASYLATQKFQSLFGRNKKSVMKNAIKMFKTGAATSEASPSAAKKKINDRLKGDKIFLKKLTKVESLVSSKKYSVFKLKCKQLTIIFIN